MFVVGGFFYQIFVHTCNTHKITFYPFIRADVCGREVTALLSSWSSVDSQGAELGKICYRDKSVGNLLPG